MNLPEPYYIGEFLITPHVKAPQFSNPAEAPLLFRQAVAELLSENPQLNSAETVQLIRELGFVSMWFFLSGILAPYGPYDLLTDPLSISMVNFRQSSACERPGAHAAVFVPRGFYKSVIFTHGGDTWDLLRNPDERIVIVNAISEKAESFFHQIQSNIVSNDLVHLFYPEIVPGKKGKSTDKELILPNRTRAFPDPSLRAMGLTGAAEGGHYTLISLDDLVGLDSVDQARQSNMTMETAKKWFRTNRRALRVDETSRILLAATRFAMDDCYQDVYSSCHSVSGYTDGDLQADPSGEWDVYYRLVEENGVYIRPNVMNKLDFERLLREDYWSAMTQYVNAPMKAGLAEFAEYNPGDATLIWEESSSEWFLRLFPDPNFSDVGAVSIDIPLAQCDVLVSTDLAATDTGIKAKTCRSSLAAWATTPQGKHVRFWSRVGFFSIEKILDYVFDVNALFKGYVRTTIIESNAFQKIIKPIIEKEMRVRDMYFSVTPVNATGDKKARIRAALGQELPKNGIWLCRGSDKEFREELRMFPMSDSRVDVLDESEKAIVFAIKPATQDEIIRKQYEEEDEQQGVMSAVGY